MGVAQAAMCPRRCCVARTMRRRWPGKLGSFISSLPRLCTRCSTRGAWSSTPLSRCGLAGRAGCRSGGDTRAGATSCSGRPAGTARGASDAWPRPSTRPSRTRTPTARTGPTTRTRRPCSAACARARTPSTRSPRCTRWRRWRTRRFRRQARRATRRTCPCWSPASRGRCRGFFPGAASARTHRRGGEAIAGPTESSSTARFASASGFSPQVWLCRQFFARQRCAQA
mmetsp:Transcript_23125/g.87511  ORF Transcript_23125/g.87511 Transcript_23125/m.87511 type:complete len:227 (-) Transcript_23125:477-1157(-)